MASHVPSSSHCRRRRQQVDPLGYPSGRSRHRAPVVNYIVYEVLRPVLVLIAPQNDAILRPLTRGAANGGRGAFDQRVRYLDRWIARQVETGILRAAVRDGCRKVSGVPGCPLHERSGDGINLVIFDRDAPGEQRGRRWCSLRASRERNPSIRQASTYGEPRCRQDCPRKLSWQVREPSRKPGASWNEHHTNGVQPRQESTRSAQ